MQVTSATVRYLKRIQPAQYEPAEAEVSVSVTFTDSENDVAANNAAIEDAMGGVRRQVYAALNRQVPGEPVPPPQAKKADADKPAATRGRPAKDKTADAPARDDAKAEAEADKPATVATEAKQEPAKAADPAPSAGAPAVNTTIDLKGLKDKIGGLIRDGKIKPDAVKGLYPAFKVTRLDELKPGSVSAFDVAVDHLVNGGGNSSVNDL